MRFCSLPELLTADASMNAWRKRHLRWALTGSLPGVSEEDHVAVIEAAFGYWAAVCGLTFELTDSARAADIRLGTGPIDGSGRTLAWSELPNGSDGPLRQLYDTGELWSSTLDREYRGGIPLVVTAAHEIGHALGLGHSRDPKALMAPTLNVAAWVPQADDIREVRERYGPPRTIPTPPTGGSPELRILPASREVILPEGWRVRAG